MSGVDRRVNHVLTVRVIVKISLEHLKGKQWEDLSLRGLRNSCGTPLMSLISMLNFDHLGTQLMLERAPAFAKTWGFHCTPGTSELGMSMARSALVQIQPLIQSLIWCSANTHPGPHSESYTKIISIWKIKCLFTWHLYHVKLIPGDPVIVSNKITLIIKVKKNFYCNTYECSLDATI